MKYNDKYLSRIDTRNAHGWYLRMPEDFKEDPLDYHSKFFSDGPYKGNIKAKQAARDYRDKHLKETGQMYLLDTLRKVDPGGRYAQSNNTSGIIGVRRTVQIKETDAGSICISEAWIGYGMIDHKPWCKSFSVGEKHKETTAFKAACIERHHKHGPLKVKGKVGRFPCQIPVKYVKIK